jgi:predicted Fe-Mo cluster-binding NifX family protein
MEGSCRSGAAITVCVRSQGTAAARTAGSAGVRSAAVITDQEENLMKIAVTYENEQIFQHFGHCEAFKVYEVENSKVLSSQVVGTGGSGHEALAVFLKNLGVETLICGGIGGGARTALAQAGIELYPGASGNADEAVDALLKGNLAYDPDTMCNHHHEGGEHSCHGHGGSCSH